jgi:biopolymer transport protein ExbD
MYSKSFEIDQDVSLDLTPLIDTVFILLIFFILTTTFSKPVLEVVLAKADSASIQDVVQEKCTVTITKDGRILFDDEAIPPEEIATRLETLPKDAPIVFNVDTGAQFGLFVLVLDAAKGQGRSNFIINASPMNGKGRDQSGSDK